VAEIKVRKPPTKPVREKREDALERLLLLACRLIPDDLSLLGDKKLVDLAEDVTGEAAFWLDLQPRGAKVHATSPELRLGWKDVQERRLSWLPELDANGALVPATRSASNGSHAAPAKAAK